MRRLRLPFTSLLILAGCTSDGEGETTSATTEPSGTSTGVDETITSAGSMSTAGETTGTSPSGTSLDPTTGPGPADLGGTAGTSTGESSGAVVMETTLGTITIELFPEQAPVTVDNFVAYVAEGFYDGTDGLGQTIFHRVIPGFVIQGGGLTDALQGKATLAPIVNEHDSSGLTNDRGTLSMARTSDPDSATSQFFVNLVDNPGLDESPGYAVFAQVVEGLDIVDAIGGVDTTDMPPYTDVPLESIYITSVTLE